MPPTTGLQHVETLVIGAGHAGLATSYHLKERGCDHVVLEQGSVAQTWRSKRWDSFTLATPNWMLRLPGFEYVGDDPDGFLERDEVIEHLNNYSASFGAPVQSGVRVESLQYAGPDSAGRYVLRTTAGLYRAENVVVASGDFFSLRVKTFAAQLPGDVVQLSSDTYRNPAQLPSGGVLVVGSAQSGAQIAEELLYDSDHPVYLAVGNAGRLPRRYRHKDATWWMVQMAQVKGLQTVHDLSSNAAKYAANPHVSGKAGGHTINLRQLRRDGAVLLGHMRSVDGDRAWFEPDLEHSLSQADAFAAKFKQNVDDFIELMGWEMPPELTADPVDREYPLITELDLRDADISSVIWATGYRPDFSWVQLPIFDDDGYPVQHRGVSSYPGLHFVGLPWLHTAASGLIAGVGDDAAHVVEVLCAQRRLSNGHP